MSVLESKQHLRALPAQDIAEIKAFLAELEAAAFDARLETDSGSGVFDGLIEKLERQIDSRDERHVGTFR
jgi:hypothetical protein